MSINSDQLTHVQVVNNYLYSVTQFCTSKDMLAHILGALSIGDVIAITRSQHLFMVQHVCFSNGQLGHVTLPFEY